MEVPEAAAILGAGDRLGLVAVRAEDVSFDQPHITPKFHIFLQITDPALLL